MFSSVDYEPSSATPVVHVQPTPTGEGQLRCFVLESASVGPGRLSRFIAKVVQAHRQALARALQTPLQPSDIRIESDTVNNALANGATFGETISRLNAADVAIIDVTSFEPGVMFLLGIRSVLRQGVTLITTHENFEAHHWSQLPFNLKELYPLYINETHDINSPTHPLQWFGRTMADALTEHRALPQYQDSPAHEHVRRLGPSATYFGRVSAETGILWLCPFAKEYMKEFGSEVQDAVKIAFGLDVPFQRITEIVSPQLVSQRLYSAMRRRDLCVVDWTSWSANVFYELGVRLAVNRFSTVSILAGGVNGVRANARPVTELEREQRRRLVKLLAPIEYSASDTAALGQIKDRHDRMILCATDPTALVAVWGDIPFDHVYRLIASLSSPDVSALHGDVDQLLKTQAGILIGSGGTTNFSNPVLYADASSTLANEAKARGTEMLLASWFYASERLGMRDIRADRLGDPVYEQQMKSYLDLGERIIALLDASSSEEDRQLGNVLQGRVDRLRKEMRKGAANVGSGRPSTPV